MLAGASPLLVHNCGTDDATQDLYRVSPKEVGADELENGFKPENFPYTDDGQFDGSAHFGDKARVEDFIKNHGDTHGQGMNIGMLKQWLDKNGIVGDPDIEGHEFIIPRRLFGELNEFPRSAHDFGRR
ncbi:hypothetical protein L6E12_18265 [Actinokineospora sp. PR83]|uniref:hypothetical protein n=1 Tax=Actinokineospora sp. PR83 TaxID=2884908 RepID=UPI001F3560CF|nr:hypothetical protein [Actinokineospora sp. PR83]MCG8917728.1 hypothetical protein [Actinokineospora sp. PR83]